MTPHPNRAMRARRIVTAVSVLLLSTALDLFAYGPGCPYCTNEPLVVSSTDPQLQASVKWCCIDGSPSCDNPALACQSDFKTMLWRRHERASDCLWIAQCKLTLRSGGAIQKSDYVQITDQDNGVGNLGDVVITSGTELVDTWDECDMEWAAQPKGILSVSANGLIDAGGTQVARGVAYQGSITYPYMMVADPDIFCQLNERSLAHEAGHVLNLGHVGTGGNLMQTGGAGFTLDLGQCTTARNYLSSNTILDPPVNQGPRPDLVDYVFDPRDDGSREAPWTDIGKVVITDNSASGGILSLALATAGILPRDQESTWWVSMDVDNNPDTGGRPDNIIPGGPMGGVELVAQIEALPDGQTLATMLEPGPLGGFVPVPLAPGLLTARVKQIDLVICDPEPGYQGPNQIPAFSEVQFEVANEALEILGLPPDGSLFPEGVLLQAASQSPFSQEVDFAPDEGGLAEMPPIFFPTIDMAEQVQQGETVPVQLGGMPPNADVTFFFGEFDIDVGAATDEDGNSAFDFMVPMDAQLGFTNVSAGIDDPNNAMTADTIVEVLRGGGDCGGNYRLTHTASNVVRGEAATFTASGATSGELVFFVRSLAGAGCGDCPPQIGGQCLDIESPFSVLGSAVADASGTATLTLTIPAGAPAGELATQAVAIRGPGGVDSVKSLPVVSPIQ